MKLYLSIKLTYLKLKVCYYYLMGVNTNMANGIAKSDCFQTGFQYLSTFSNWSNNQIFLPQNTIGWANVIVLGCLKKYQKKLLTLKKLHT